MKSKNYEFTKAHTQIAKGVAITLMMTYHLFAFPDRIQKVSYISVIPFLHPSIESLLGNFGGICVAMYLFLSGYGLYISSLKKEKFTFRDTSKKIIKFLINYWVVFVIFVPIGMIWFTENKVYEWNIVRFITNFFTLSYSYNGEWWFASLYIELLLIFPTIKKLLQRNIKFSLAIILGLYIISFVMEVIPRFFPELVFLKRSLIYGDIKKILFWQMTFCLGCIAARFNLFSYINKNILCRRLDTKAFYSTTMLVIIGIRIGATYVFKSIGIGNATYVDFILAPPFILICTNLIYGSGNKNIFSILGKHSTNMWLSHSFFCYYYFQKLVFLPKLSILIVIWLAVLSIASSILINFLIKIFRRKEVI